MRPEIRAALAAAVVCLGSACSGGAVDAGASATPEPGIPTLTVSPLPEEPPTGTFLADMRQSSLDAAAGQMQVWIDNDTVDDATPARIVYRDPRLRRPLVADRLREIPSQATRGFRLVLPDAPRCSRADAESSLEDPLGTITVEIDGRSEEIAVADETDVVGRYARARCTEIEVARVASLRWDDEVTDSAPEDAPRGSVASLVLVIEPTGRTGRTLEILTVSGTPVLSPSGSDVWRPGVTVVGTDAPSRIALALKPNRCDAHAFQEGGGATAFKIALALDGAPGQITLRMSTAGAANAITYARASCGLLTTIEDE